MSLRIRQIVLAARDLATTVRQCGAALGLAVDYRDPEVARFGLENALLSIGDQFLEIVAPTRPDTAAGRHLDRHGDSAYMLILQTDDLDRDRHRLDKLGVRVVWESNYPDMRAIHLHPKDIGAAIVSLDQATPPSSWRWAGPNWQGDEIAVDHSQRISSATIGAHDPARMAQRWSEVLGLAPPEKCAGVWRLAIQDGALDFIAATLGVDRIIAFDLAGDSTPTTVKIGGTTFNRQGSRCLA